MDYLINLFRRIWYRIKFEYQLVRLKIKIDKEPKNGYMLINKTSEIYFTFSACYAKDVASLILYAIGEGYKPIININDVDGSALHDIYFEQPYCNHDNNHDIFECSLTRGNIDISFANMFRKDIARLYMKVYDRYLRINETTARYIKDDYASIINDNMKVLGVLVRGTDYLRLKPAFHPVQPAISDVINECRDVIKKYRYTHIYLATEEEKYEELFDQEFPNIILTNKRHYIGNKYWSDETSHCYKVSLDIENENKTKGLEYLSSLEILAKCNGLVAGNCGGSQYSYLRNNGKYEYCHIYDLGLYPSK